MEEPVVWWPGGQFNIYIYIYLEMDKTSLYMVMCNVLKGRESAPLCLWNSVAPAVWDVGVLQ